MNPDRHMKSHYDYFLDLIRGDDGSVDFHRDFYDEYNAVLDMPAEYYLDTIKTVFQDFSLVNGTWEVGWQAGAAAGHQGYGAADDRRRARRYFRRWPDPCGARPVYRHHRSRTSSITTSKVPGTTASSRAAAGARRFIRRSVRSLPPMNRRRPNSGSQPPLSWQAPTVRCTPSTRRWPEKRSAAPAWQAVLPESPSPFRWPSCRHLARVLQPGQPLRPLANRGLRKRSDRQHATGSVAADRRRLHPSGCPYRRSVAADPVHPMR